MTRTPPGDQMGMKLWHIARTDRGGYDTYDSAVVAAPDEAQARSIHPDGVWKWLGDAGWRRMERPTEKLPEWARPSGVHGDWTHPANVTATLIGEALPGQQEGVICASFNAG